MESCFGDVLQFYGVELQSHAGQILGLSILVFAVIQAWGQLIGSKVPSNPVLFSIFVGALGVGIAHQIIRLFQYGKLASSILYSSASTFRVDKVNFQWKQRQLESWYPNYWREVSNFLKASIHAGEKFERDVRRYRKLGIYYVTVKSGSARAWWVLASAFAAGLFLSYFYVFGASDSSAWPTVVDLGLGAIELAVIVDLYRGFKGWQMWHARTLPKSTDLAAIELAKAS